MKVFLSSTYEDLREHRAKAAQAIERLGQQGVRMEVFGARPGDATDVCREEIEASDAFLGIYAHRYGHVPSGSSASITEQEFDFAQEQRKPTFCFLVDDEFPWSPKFIETEPGQSKLKLFKQRVSATFVRDTFTTPDDLAYKIASSLGRFLITTKVKAKLESIPATDRVSTQHGRDQVSRRAARLQSLIRGACVLLVNDVPEEMQHVVAILRELGINVEVVTTTEEALSRVHQNTYDVIVSDMRRGTSLDEGLGFLTRMRQDGIHRPTIFTVGQYRPDLGTPPFAFGITNRADELLNLLFDAIERRRG
jgi:CheY-like chemotaxis protein